MTATNHRSHLPVIAFAAALAACGGTLDLSELGPPPSAAPPTRAASLLVVGMGAPAGATVNLELADAGIQTELAEGDSGEHRTTVRVPPGVQLGVLRVSHGGAVVSEVPLAVEAIEDESSIVYANLGARPSDGPNIEAVSFTRTRPQAGQPMLVHVKATTIDGSEATLNWGTTCVAEFTLDSSGHTGSIVFADPGPCDLIVRAWDGGIRKSVELTIDVLPAP